MTDPNASSPGKDSSNNATDSPGDNDQGEKKREDQGGRPLPQTENLFMIVDGLVDQLNTTKRMFIIMILSIMILPPLSLIISFAIADAVTEGHPWFFLHRDPWIFSIARNLPLIISLVWLGIGIRQWFVLSNWAKRYQRFKDKQREIDKKLLAADKDDEHHEDKSP